MKKTEAIKILEKIKKPLLVEGGTWQFGHTYYILTSEGLVTADCTAYPPIYGPMKLNEATITKIKNSLTTEAPDDLAGFEWEAEEILVVVNDGLPNTEYWAYQPYDCAPLNEWTISNEYKDIEELFVNEALDNIKAEPWKNIEEADLINWVEHVKKGHLK